MSAPRRGGGGAGEPPVRYCPPSPEIPECNGRELAIRDFSPLRRGKSRLRDSAPFC